MLKNHQNHEKKIFLKFLIVFLIGAVLVFLIKNETIPGVFVMTNQNKNFLFLTTIILWLATSFYFGKNIRRKDQPHCPCLKCSKERLAKKEKFLNSVDEPTRKIWKDYQKK